MAKIKIFAFADEANPTIDGQIEAMRRNGLNGLEIRNVDDINIADISAKKAYEIKEKMDAANMQIWSIGSPFGKVVLGESGFEEHIEKLKRTMEIADILEAKCMRMFSLYIPQDRKIEDCTGEVIDKVAQMVDVITSHGVIPCLENERGLYADIPERCLKLYKALPNLKGIFDPANFIQRGIDTIEAWQALKEHTLYLHIKDALTDGTVVVAGTGEGNIKFILDEFIEMGGNAVTIEPHLTVRSGFSHLKKKNDELDSKYIYSDSNTAFDAACSAFKSLL